MTQTAKSEITADFLYRVTSKADGRECYFVPSDSQPGVYYQTCWDVTTQGWTCTCKAGEVAAERGRSVNCKHSRAAQLVIVERKNREREEAAREQARKAAEAERERFARAVFAHEPRLQGASIEELDAEEQRLRALSFEESMENFLRIREDEDLAGPRTEAVICDVCGVSRTYHSDGVCGRCRC